MEKATSSAHNAKTVIQFISLETTLALQYDIRALCEIAVFSHRILKCLLESRFNKINCYYASSRTFLGKTDILFIL